MKLAFCLFKYFPHGGLQRDFLRIANECVARGHQVNVYTMHWEGKQVPHLPVKIIQPNGWQNHTRCQQFVRELQPHLASGQYHAVIGFNKMPGLDIYYAADTCFQAKARLQHGAWYRFMPRFRHLVAYENAVFSIDAKTKILLISKAQQSDFQQYYQTPSTRFYLLPPGIAKDRIAPPNAGEIRQHTRAAWNIKHDQFLLLMVGSGFRTKGLDRILQGVAALPATIKQRARLFIIGKDKAESFQAQAKQLGIAHQVEFLSGRDDVPQFLLAADLLLHPAYNENTGTVLLEAVISGLPVLTTDVCGYAEYVRIADAGCVLSSPFQQTEFNETLQAMLMSQQRDTWRQNGLAFAQSADIYRMPQCATDMIESICK